jgi:hypothetical protein
MITLEQKRKFLLENQATVDLIQSYKLDLLNHEIEKVINYKNENKFYDIIINKKL